MGHKIVEKEEILRKYTEVRIKTLLPTNAVLRVRLKNGLEMYHSRSGLTVETAKATVFKTLKHAVRVAKKKYSPRITVFGMEQAFPDRDVKEWHASTLGYTALYSNNLLTVLEKEETNFMYRPELASKLAELSKD